MRKLRFTNLWITAFLLAGLLGGCGDSDTNAGKPGSPLTPPSVNSTNPLTGSTFTCSTPVVINATFSKAMNPATINTTTFTLFTGSTSTAGSVTYVAATNVATFTPSAPLSPNSLYVATITTGAQDQFGNGLTANFTWSFTTSPPCPPPTVSTVTPPNLSATTCPNSAVITATFSTAMNPASINMTTFTLTAPGGASVTGAVSYVVATEVATFTPAAALSPSTLYTATITTGATNAAGTPLAANFVWKFTTTPTCTPPAVISLGAACSFGILAATPAVSNTGPTIVKGDIGIWPAASITGFGAAPGVLGPGIFTGTEHLGDSIAMTAQTDLTTAFNLAMNAGGGPSVGTALTADIGGQTLPPGIYKATNSLGITGNLTLDGSTNPNGAWIFKVGTALTTAAGGVGTPASQVLLIGGAQAHNVFWQIGSAATLGTNSLFQGTIMANATITLTTGATLNGRALDRSAAVALDSNPVNVPSCP
jgi:Ice-binding-like/Bacterial Ig-like domain